MIMPLAGNSSTRVESPERRNDERVATRELHMLYSTGMEQKRAEIKNISFTGVYLLTENRWSLGTPLTLTLQRVMLESRDSNSQVRLQARVVRQGDDGVGLTFVPEYIGTTEWLDLMHKAASLIQENDAIRMFRMTKALAFLLRVSPAAEGEILRLLTEELADERTERALNIVLKAEAMVASKSSSLKTGVSPDLTLRILGDASQNDDERAEPFWVGMLAALSVDGVDDTVTLSLGVLLSAFRNGPRENRAM